MAFTTVPGTMANVLNNAKATLVAAGTLGTADNTKLAMPGQMPQSPPAGYLGNELWVIAPSGDWRQEDGQECLGSDDLLLAGELLVGYWLRLSTEGEGLADSYLTDTVIGEDGKVSHLLSLLHQEESTGLLLDGSNNTPLMRPLMFKGMSFSQTPGTSWRGVVVTYECEYRTIAY